MRAVVLHGRGDLRLEERPTPTPAPGELLLAVGTVGLCGTDAHEYAHGPHMFPLTEPHPVTGHVGPMVIGHEFSGTVVATGAGVGDDWLGQLVASCGSVPCGTCWQCTRGRSNLCIAYAGVGLHRDGALAEFVVTPAANCTRVHDLGLTPDAAALGQPMSIAVHARRRGQSVAGETIVVIGVGGIGAFLTYVLARAGCHVLATDVDQDRLNLATAMGATWAIPAVEPDEFAARVRDTVRVDPVTVYEATGRPAGFAAALASLPRGGRLVVVGLQGDPISIDLRHLAVNEVEFIGTNAMVREKDFDEALSLIARRQEGWADIAPTVFSPQEVVRGGMEQLVHGRGPIKTLVDPRAVHARRAHTLPLS